MIIKYKLFWLILTIKSIFSQEIKNDFCNINESQAAFLIINDIVEYFKINNTQSSDEKCLLLNENLINYYKGFVELEKSSKHKHQTVKCNLCEKSFKNRSFLNLHFKLFHLSKIKNFSEKYYCPGDFCRFINCDRYKNYYGISFPDNSLNSINNNNQVKEKYQECNKELISFYKNSCMKLIAECFLDEEDNDKYFEYYNNFCMKITCERNKENSGFSYNLDLHTEGSVWETLRIVILYIVSIFILIYLMIIWIMKYS